MKKLLLPLLALVSSLAHAQSTSGSYTNFIRQYQLPSGVVYQLPVAANGQDQSPLPINPGGARFELWTVNSVTAQSYNLESRYVASYVPMASVAITSEDPYDVVPRTRADRPFNVTVTVDGLLVGDPTAPAAAKKVSFLRHVQPFASGGTSVGLDRTQATLLSQSYLEENGTAVLTFAVTSIPGANRAKVRGEERFSVFSLPDTRTEESSGLTYEAPAAQLASQRIEIWPVANGTMAGITANKLIRYKMPVVTAVGYDLYPGSTTYVQAYKGAAQLGKSGTILGQGFVNTHNYPVNKDLTFSDYDIYFPDEGQWTMELVTKTPFGIDRLAYVTFTLDRTIQMNGSMTTIND